MAQKYRKSAGAPNGVRRTLVGRLSACEPVVCFTHCLFLHIVSWVLIACVSCVNTLVSFGCASLKANVSLIPCMCVCVSLSLSIFYLYFSFCVQVVACFGHVDAVIVQKAKVGCVGPYEELDVARECEGRGGAV